MNDISVVYSTDKNFLLYTLGSIYSVLKNTESTIHFVIIIDFDTVTAEAGMTKLEKYFSNFTYEIVPLDSEKLPDEGTLLSHISAMTFARLMTPSLLVEYEWVIYLDGDTYVNSDIEELYRFASARIQNNDLMAVPTIGGDFKFSGINEPNKGEKIFNAGVLIMNLERLRHKKFENTFFEVLNVLPDNNKNDQAVLNVALRGQWGELPIKWNVNHNYFLKSARKLKIPKTELKKITKEPGIVHFTSNKKPWTPDWFLTGNEFVKPYQDILKKMDSGFSVPPVSFSMKLKLLLRKTKGRF